VNECCSEGEPDVKQDSEVIVVDTGRAGDITDTLRWSVDQIGKQPDKADQDKIYSDDVVEYPRHQEDQNAGDQCDERLNGRNVDGHRAHPITLTMID
jgi:hypothetical protein